MKMTEAAANIGASVVYHPKGRPPEDGVISGVSGTFVFVRYEGGNGSKATAPEDLTFRFEGGTP